MTDTAKLVAASMAVPLLLAGAAAQAREEVLFNGRDLSGWEASFGGQPPAAGRTPGDFISAKDGAIMCRGGQHSGGWLHTLRSYADFDLHLEFKWGQIDPAVKAAGGNIYNSGVFLRSNPGRMPDGGQSMMSYQGQIIHTPARSSGEAGGGTGDAWLSGYDNPSFTGERPGPKIGGGPRPVAASGGAAPPPAPSRFRAPPPGVSFSRVFQRTKFAEKPIGEWNSYDIAVHGDKLTYRLNGELVNEVSGAMAMSGKIGLECENTPIFFRNIRVTTPE